MAECIEREVIKKLMLKYGFKAPDMIVTEFVNSELPSVDVVSILHGQWEWSTKELYPKPLCSRCKYESYRASNHQSDLPNYCPNCGVKMDG